MHVFIVYTLLYVPTICSAQIIPSKGISNKLNQQSDLSEKIGNFSLEILYHTAKLKNQVNNLVMSPMTLWTVLAVVSEGASGFTREQIIHALRLNRNRTITRLAFKDITNKLIVNASTVELAKFNAIFIDYNKILERDFQQSSKTYYDTEAVQLNFRDNEKTATSINQYIYNFTHGRIPKLIESSDFENLQMVLTSAVYFKGQWKSPFNASSTLKMPFYDNQGSRIGEVNMMYNRYTYPFANIKELQSRVLEIPYGKEDRLSMLIMLPNPGISLEDMFLKFRNVPLDLLFKELNISREEFGEDEVDCFIPRFKIETDLELTDVVKQLGIIDLFDERAARLTRIARMPMYVSKVIHKAEIEVNEEGTTASAVTAAEFANRIGIIRFEANRPFTYLIIEKSTNSIVFGGIYRKPTLY